MRINSKYIYSLLGVSLALTACSSEELTSPSGNAGETVLVSLTVNRPSDKTRTVLTEIDGGLALKSEWETGDKVLVINSTNQKVGELTLEGEGGEGVTSGVFSGTLEGVVDGGSYTVYYLGATDNGNGPYTKAVTENGLTTVVNTLASSEGCDVVGTFNDLRRADFLKEEIKLAVKDGIGYQTDDVNLKSQNAMVHFKLTNLPTTLADDASLTVTYANGTHSYTYTVSNKAADLYIAVIPGSYAFTFNLESGDDKYTATIGDASKTLLKAGMYYATDDATATTGTGIEVTLGKETKPDPYEGTVGPTIEINGKYYRFMRGNLYCDILDKDNYMWYLYERETDYQLKAGTSSLSTSGYYVRQINGEWNGSSTRSNVGADNHIIDLFPWGATGLGTGSYKAKLPDIIRKGEGNERSYSSSNWPSGVTNTSDTKGNAYIINLWQNYSFDAPIYDFGYAYMQTGAKKKGDTRTFVTAPLEAYAFICNPEKSFSQGCVVKGANYDGTSDAKGALILYGITELEDAKAAIKAVGGSVDSSFDKLSDTNKPNCGFNYLINLPNYESIEDINKLTELNGKAVNIQALFFASGGNATYTFKAGNIGYNSLNPTDGAYWSCNGAKGSSTVANAYGFYFRKGSTASEFCWTTDASGVSSGRNTQRSVRLMVEVPNPENLVGD